MPPARRARLLRGLLSVALTGLLLAWVARVVRPDEVLARLRATHLGWVALAAALVPLQVLLCAERWRRVARVQGVDLPRGRALREYALSTLLNPVLPGGVAGDALRTLRHRSHAGGLAPALRSVVVERAVGQVALQALAAAAVLAWALRAGPAAVPGWVLGLGLAAVLGVATLVGTPRRMPGLGTVAADLRAVACSPQAAPVAALSAAFLGTLVAGFAASAAAVGAPLGLTPLLTVPLLLLAMSVPLTVGGWGLREAAAATLLPLVGGTAEAGVALSVVYGLASLLGALPGALALLPGGRA